MKIYTKTGDLGETGIIGGLRVSKDHVVVCACGDVDETNSLIGMACSFELNEPVSSSLNQIQQHLFVIGSQIANCQSGKPDRIAIDSDSIALLESLIDRHDQGLPPLDAFIIPSGCPGAAQLHVARCVCRRAERSVVGLVQCPDAKSDLGKVVVYLNRLSDLLFVLARRVNFENECTETKWLP